MFEIISSTIIAFAVSTVFLLASTSAFAEYSQQQNTINDIDSE